jgi:hypothetical protein
MTVNEIFDAIKDYKDLDIWVDNGDQMWAADGTMETAQEMLDAIEEGARVEARIYYDEDGNRVPSSEYSSNVDVETVFDSDDSIANEYGDGKRFVKLEDGQFDRLNRLKGLGQLVVYKAIKNKYGKKHCFFDNWAHQFAYKDDTRTISLSVIKNANGEPYESDYMYFDKKENYKNTATYQVTSWDEVIEHFIDEIEEM